MSTSATSVTAGTSDRDDEMLDLHDTPGVAKNEGSEATKNPLSSPSPAPSDESQQVLAKAKARARAKAQEQAREQAREQHKQAL